MCTIIARTEDTGVITQDECGRAAVANPDGWGCVWPRSTRGKQGLEITRNVTRGTTLDVSSAPARGPLAVHWRLATHGKVDVDNAHPFALCGGGYALLHNGIFGNAPEVYPGKSDTWHVARLIIDPILAATPADALESAELMAVLESIAGRGNKLVIMRDDGRQVIVNRDSGIERGGAWHSNGGALAPPPTAQGTLFRETTRPGAGIDYGKLDWSRWDDDERDIPDWRDTPRIHDRGGDITLQDLRHLDFEDIVDLCLEDPEAIASMIVSEIA